MSHEANGLFPFAGGLGMPDAWRTSVVEYGPANAVGSGRRINRAEAPAAGGRCLSTWLTSIFLGPTNPDYGMKHEGPGTGARPFGNGQ